MKALLLGYYGYRNIGDDLFVKSLVDYFTLNKIGASFICNENYYNSYFEEIANIDFYNDSEVSKLKRLMLVAESDYIAWGGGTLQLDSKPTNLINLRRISSLFRRKFGFLGVGLEGSRINAEKSTKRLFENSDFIYLRDKASYEAIQNNMDFAGKAFLGGDLAFLSLGQYSEFLNKKQRDSIQNVSFSGKHWWGEGRAEFYSKPLIKLIEKYNCTVHMLPCCLGDGSNDNEFHERLAIFLPQKNYKIYTWDKPESFLKVMSEMDFHVGNRLHSIILADILGIPNIGINGDPPKIRAYIEKTSLLVKERTTEFMDEIALERIEKIFSLYERPDAFIAQEASTALNVLKEIFI